MISENKILTSESRATLQGIGWSERNVMQLHQQFHALFRSRLSPAAQNFFAMPEVVDSDRVDYYCADYSSAKKLEQQWSEVRRETKAKIETIVDEIEALRQDLARSPEQNDQNLARALDKALFVPNQSAIWIVDGQPVVTLWGMRSETSKLDMRSIKAPKQEIKRKPIPLWPFLVALGAGIAAYLAFLLVPTLYCFIGIGNCGAPIARDDAAVMQAGASYVDIDVVSNDSDPDGDLVTLSYCDAPGAVLNGSTVRYARGSSESPVVSFTCEVTDPAGNTALSTVTVAHAPMAMDNTAVLLSAENFVEIDVVANDLDDDGDAITVTSCDAPGIVRPNGMVRYNRVATVSGSIRFSCTVGDPDGNMDSAFVTISIEDPPNTPPFAQPVTATLSSGSASITIDVLSGASDADINDSLRVVSCTPPGRLSGQTVTYQRNANDSVLQESFDCRIEDLDGAGVAVPVTVQVAPEEITRCTPINRNLPVRLLVGLDWSGSMTNGDPDLLTPSHEALSRAARQLPATTVGTVSFMSAANTPVEQSIQSPFRPIGERSTGSPNFEYYASWLSHQIAQAGTQYALITVVTITDAEPQLAEAHAREIARAFAAAERNGVLVEHIVLSLEAGANMNSYRAMVWPASQAQANLRDMHFRPGDDPRAFAQTLANEILEATRAIEAVGCEGQ